MKYASDIMNTEVFWVKENDTIRDAVKIMADKKISGLPVLKDGNVVGIVTESDIIRHGKKIFMPEHIELLDVFLYSRVPERFEEELKRAMDVKIIDIMSDSVITAGIDTPVGELALIMIENDINRIPILKNGDLVGIVGREDIIKSISLMKRDMDPKEE